MYGEHSSLVSWAATPPVTMTIFLFSAATVAMARLVPELGPLMIMSTPWVSNQPRAAVAATSGLAE